MKWIKYITVFTCLAFVFAACRDGDGGEGAGRVALDLSGGVRSDGVNGADIYMRAVFGDDGGMYFDDTLIAVDGGLAVAEKPITAPGSRLYYPLGDRQVRLFAYSGKSQGGDMFLVAGAGADYDAVLSNYGRAYGEPAPNPAYEGAGTPGSAGQPAEMLQFRHVMTQLTVRVEIDRTEDPAVDREPETVQFTIDGVAASGLYPITAVAPESAGADPVTVAVAAVPADSYTVVLGENYLVPTGANLAGMQLSSLTIDDYTATEDDLAGFIIEADASNPVRDMYLYPGHSYTLTLKLRRLRVTQVTLSQTPWVPREATGSGATYDPNTITLSLGDYDDTAATDRIQRVMLYTSDGRMYVGEAGEDGDGIRFVTLPAPADVERVSLFTPWGVLIYTPVSSGSYDGSQLRLPLSGGGMLPVDPSRPYDMRSNPYAVTTNVQFMNVGKDLGAGYSQQASIDLDALNLVGPERIFNGFGDYYGIYDGNGYYISGLDINAEGLFLSNRGLLANVRITDSVIDADGFGYAGSLCAVNDGVIVGCVNEGRIINAPDVAGGICGRNMDGAQVLACVNTGMITDALVTGGIAGVNENPAAGAIAACINIGMLNHSADAIGGICGTSVPSAESVIRRCYWLVGSAQEYVGGPEVVVDSDNVGYFDSNDLDPGELRNNLAPGEPEGNRILNKLNDEISLMPAPWNTLYEYVLDPAATGITWPVPVRKN